MSFGARMAFTPLHSYLNNSRPGYRHLGPVVPVRFAGREGLFLLDTGTPLTYVRRSHAKRLKRNGTFAIRDIAFSGEMAPMDDAQLDRLQFHRLDGIVGSDVLHQTLLHLDFPRQQLTFFPASANRQATLSELGFHPGGYQTLALYGTKQNTLLIDLLIDERFSDLGLIDTGADNSLVAMPAAVASKPPSQRTVAHQRDWFGAARSEIASFQLGVSSYRKSLSRVLLRYRGQDTNLLGTDFLGDFEILIDVPNALLYLKPTTPTIETRTPPFLPSKEGHYLALPGDESYLEDRANNLIHAERYAAALSTLMQLERLSSSNPRLWQYRGTCFWQLGRKDEAVAALQRATLLDSKEPTTWKKLGRACAELGRFAEARKAFQKAIELVPGDAKLWRELADTLEQLGDYSGSQRAFVRAVSL